MKRDKKAYSKQKHRIAVINILLSPAIIVVSIMLALPVYVKNVVLQISSNEYLNLIAFSALMGIIYYLLLLPLGYYSGFVLEHRYSLSNQRLSDWVKREVKKGVVSFVVSMPLIFALYTFLKYWPMYWWILMAGFSFFISIFVTKFTPILILPFFYKYSRIENAKLRDRLIRLSQDAGFKIEDVYRINMSKDTKKANAGLTGLGRQKRIVLGDTLLNHFNNDEIEIVMAHEIGHNKKQHVLRLTLFGGLFTVVTFFLASIVFLRLHDIFRYTLLHDFESLILIFAVVSMLNIFILPLRNAFSRRLEVEADLFALETTKRSDVFIATMKKLAEQNLADINPGAFYRIMLYNHPPISRRISFAETFKRKEQGIF